MKYARLIVLAIIAVLAAGMLAACGASDEDGGSSGSGVLSGGGSAEASETAGDDGVPNDADTVIGQAVIAGPCELLVTKVERGEKFGRLFAKEGVLLAVHVQIKNVSDTGINLVGSDFQVTDGESYTTAIEGDDDLTPAGIIAPGETRMLTPVFNIPPFIEGRPLTFVYQSIMSGEAVHIEVPLQ